MGLSIKGPKGKPSGKVSKKPSVMLDYDGINPDHGGSSHGITVKVSSPYEASGSVKLLHPVQSEGHKVVMKTANDGSHRLILTLPKSDYWPEDSSVLPRVSVANLHLDNIMDMASSLGRMFTLKEATAKSAEMDGRAPVGGAAAMLRTPEEKILFDVKETIQAILSVTAQHGGKLVHSLMDTGRQTGGNEAAITLLVHAVGFNSEGRLLGHISYIDHELALLMYPGMQEKMAAGHRFFKIITTALNITSLTGSNVIQCVPGEMPLLRKILKKNAQQLEVPPWQKKLLNEAVDWEASFLAPLFSDENTAGRDFEDFVDNYNKHQGQATNGQDKHRKDTSRKTAAEERSSSDVGKRRTKDGTSARTSSGSGGTGRKLDDDKVGSTGNSLDACVVCGKKVEKMMRCSRCKSGIYCQRACQVKDWPKHKVQCQSTAAVGKSI